MATNAPDDVELLRAWRDGHDDAGERLFDRYFLPLHRFFEAKVAAGAEDLVQQTLLACLEGKERIRDESHFRAYMYGAARRILYQWLKRKHVREPSADFSVASMMDLNPGLETNHLAQEDERLLLEGLRRLPLDYQITLELRFWAGLTGPELAAALDVPEGTVRTRIRRGLQQLRQHIEAIEAGPSALESTQTRLSDWARAVRDEPDARA